MPAVHACSLTRERVRNMPAWPQGQPALVFWSPLEAGDRAHVITWFPSCCLCKRMKGSLQLNNNNMESDRQIGTYTSHQWELKEGATKFRSSFVQASLSCGCTHTDINQSDDATWTSGKSCARLNVFLRCWIAFKCTVCMWTGGSAFAVFSVWGWGLSLTRHRKLTLPLLFFLHSENMFMHERTLSCWSWAGEVKTMKN